MLLSLLIGLLVAAQGAQGKIHAQQVSIRPPVSALWSDGATLLIGQETTLIEALITPDSISPGRVIDLRRGTIRDIARSGAITLALSEDGLTSLDGDLRTRAFLPGGGQRLAASGDRIYIAALDRGVRLIRLEQDGELTRLGLLDTPGPAYSVIADPQLPTRIWVACSTAGARLYEIGDPEAPQIIGSLEGYAPATALALAPPRLYIGHGNAISIFDLSTLTTPRLLSTTSLDESPLAVGQSTPDPAQLPRAAIPDLKVVGNRVFATRTCADCLTPGADLVMLNIAFDGAAQVMARLGESGAGERLALRGDDIILSSERLGLQWVNFGRGQPVILSPWLATALPLATPDSASPAASPGTPPVSSVWLATAVPLPREGQLYQPPLIQINPQSAEAALALICFSFCAGVVIVVGGAWLIGVVAERVRR